MKAERIFTPCHIGNCEIPNRLVVPTTAANMCPDGNAIEQYIRYHEEKAKGSWGLITIEDYRINEHAAGYPAVVGLWKEEQIPSHQELADAIHRHGSKIFYQIYHVGCQTNRHVNGGIQPVSCSPVPCPWNKETPYELTTEDIRQLVKDFGTTALNARKAGSDGVEIHATHGYLIYEFLSPNCNHRIDEYGGTYDNRMRFLREVFSEIRTQAGPDYPVIIRFSAQENPEGGRGMSESHQMLRDMEEMGTGAIHPSNGMYGVCSSLGIVAFFFQHHGWNADFVAEAKSFLHIPVITVGRISDPCMAEDIIVSGKAGFVAMGCASLADLHWSKKARSGCNNGIRQCIGCLQGCTASAYQGAPIYCMVNPELGHELELDHSQTPSAKKISIVGAGIMGMKAARGAALKGHQVELFERNSTVGGQFISAAYPPYKGEFAIYTAQLYRKIKKHDNIHLHLNTELTAHMVRSVKPDKAILVTGAEPIIPQIPGIHNKNVVLAEDIFLGKSDTGMNILVVGGGMVGSETTAYLGMQYRSKVTVIEMGDETALDTEAGARDDLKDCLRRCYADILTGINLAGVTEEGALVKQGHTVTLLSCDATVLVIGTRASCPFKNELEGICETVTADDAVKTRQVIQASNEGFYVGYHGQCPVNRFRFIQASTVRI